MERCPNCGNKLSSIDVLCPKCGAVVEVIQTKGNIPSVSEAVSLSTAKKPETAQKKDIPKYFNVYYEDLPDEGSEDSESGAAIEEPSSEESEPSLESESLPEPKSSMESQPFYEADVYEQPGSFRAAEQPEPEKYIEKNAESREIFTAKVNDNDNDDYSPRYLENLKNLNLPEIEDISSFDPEEYMREYKYKKILANQTAVNDNSSPAKKQWLEIEETENNLASELAKAREDVQSRTAQPEIVERRYKGNQESRTERRRSFKPEKKKDYNTEIMQGFSSEVKRDYGTEAKRGYNTAIRQDYGAEISSEAAGEQDFQTPAKDNKRKTKAAVMVLFWAVITVAIFFCCMFFDSYVKNSYGTYPDFLRTITSGQVDLGPDNS